MICLGRYPRKSTLSGGRCSAPLWFARTRRFRSQGPGFYRLAKELGSMSKGKDWVVFWKAEFRRYAHTHGSRSTPVSQSHGVKLGRG